MEEPYRDDIHSKYAKLTDEYRRLEEEHKALVADHESMKNGVRSVIKGMKQDLAEATKSLPWDSIMIHIGASGAAYISVAGFCMAPRMGSQPFTLAHPYIWLFILFANMMVIGINRKSSK